MRHDDRTYEGHEPPLGLVCMKANTEHSNIITYITKSSYAISN
jgi:hypothetical protein